MNTYRHITQLLMNVGTDKYLHFIICLFMAFALQWLFADIIIAAIISMFVAVVIKEVIIDTLICHSYVDGYDILADSIGTALGIAMAII